MAAPAPAKLSSSDDKDMLKMPSLGERRCLRAFLAEVGPLKLLLKGKPEPALFIVGGAVRVIEWLSATKACFLRGVAGGVTGMGGVSTSERSPASVISSQMGNLSRRVAGA